MTKYLNVFFIKIKYSDPDTQFNGKKFLSLNSSMASLKKWTFVLVSLTCAVTVIFAVILQFQGAKMSCIFCDIVNKKSDTELLYEDEVS